MTLPSLSNRASNHGFTLLEVALATFITVGMLLVVLFFYRQSEQLRQELLSGTEQITAARMIMNRISAELRSLNIHEPLHFGLLGGSNRIEFVMATPPSPLNWKQDDLGRVLLPRSDLRVVSYELAGPGDPAEATGLARSETAVPEFAPIGVEDAILEQAAAVIDRELVTEEIRHLQFRFWDGTAWIDTWTGLHLPLGVEIILGGPPMPPPDAAMDVVADSLEPTYPFEYFRRVVPLTMRAVPFPSAGTGEASSEDITSEEAGNTSAIDGTLSP